MLADDLQQKGVMLSHRNIITNVLQAATYEAPNREWFARRKGVDASSYKEVALALLPFSHAYGLTVVSTVCAYRGDTALVLPKFELRSFLKAIEDFRITTLYTVSGSVLGRPSVLIIAGPATCHPSQEQQGSLRRVRPVERRLAGLWRCAPAL